MTFSISGAFTTVPNPDFQSYGLPEVGAFLNGKPVRQGYESAMLSFPPLRTGQWNELYSRWLGNNNAQISGALPKVSGYGWRAVSAYWHQPQFQSIDGPFYMSVTMIVSKIGDY